MSVFARSLLSPVPVVGAASTALPAFLGALAPWAPWARWEAWARLDLLDLLVLEAPPASRVALVPRAPVNSRTRMFFCILTCLVPGRAEAAARHEGRFKPGRTKIGGYFLGVYAFGDLGVFSRGSSILNPGLPD